MVEMAIFNIYNVKRDKTTRLTAPSLLRLLLLAPRKFGWFGLQDGWRMVQVLPKQVNLQYFILLLSSMTEDEWRCCDSNGFELTRHLLDVNWSLCNSHGFIVCVLVKTEINWIGLSFLKLEIWTKWSLPDFIFSHFCLHRQFSKSKTHLHISEFDNVEEIKHETEWVGHGLVRQSPWIGHGLVEQRVWVSLPRVGVGFMR